MHEVRPFWGEALRRNSGLSETHIQLLKAPSDATVPVLKFGQFIFLQRKQNQPSVTFTGVFILKKVLAFFLLFTVYFTGKPTQPLIAEDERDLFRGALNDVSIRVSVRADAADDLHEEITKQLTKSYVTQRLKAVDMSVLGMFADYHLSLLIQEPEKAGQKTGTIAISYVLTQWRKACAECFVGHWALITHRTDLKAACDRIVANIEAAVHP